MARFKAREINTWTEKQKRNVSLIVKKSIQDVSRRAQTPKSKGGRIPVVNSVLRNSYVAGLNGVNSLTGPAVYTAVIADMEMGDTFNAGWTAGYALRIEKGFVGPDSLGRVYNQSGAFFMAEALANWPQIVEANVRRVRDD